MHPPMQARLSTGVAGLDEVLDGGLLPGRTYLVRGGPGVGKTTLGLHFLAAGARQGEKALFISLEESEAALRQNGAGMGIDLTDVAFLDLSPGAEYFAEVQSYDIFTPAEVERTPLTQRIVAAVEGIRPTRVFLDPITQFRYLSTDVFQFRKQVLSFLRFLTEHGATVLFTSESSAAMPDDDLQFMADGVIRLAFGEHGRSLAVTKFRGSSFLGGSHAMKLNAQGISVFPKLIPNGRLSRFEPTVLSSGVAELDSLLHGGLERGTITFLCGPTGVGKTTLGLQFIREAARRSERSALFSFEEEIEIILGRCEGVQLDARGLMRQGALHLEKIEPLQYTPEEFAQRVRHEVEACGTQLVMLDSISGYRLSMLGRDLVSHLHALTKYLQHMDVAVLLTVETSQVTGDFRVTEREISYLADNILFLRYLEINGELRKAIGVLKKRLSDFEKTLREFEITRQGIKIGRPLTNLRGVLSGTPTWVTEKSER
ncbi:MAG: AAA family ATPase [Caldilinea sp.]|nr:AAA family ATPase [Caldilinea sp.]MDW8441353.1 ATPase domain-containing protein [Caldilineaceae bacterium]